MQTPTDAELIEAAGRGSELHAAQLYHRHADRVVRICYRVILEPHQAADCAQDVWVKVFRTLHKVDPTRSFSAWLGTVAVRTAIDWCRKHRRVRLLEDKDHDTLPDLAQDENARMHTEHQRFHDQLTAALHHLSDTQRAAFILRHGEDASYTDIATALGCAEGTAKTHVFRAIQTLRDLLNDPEKDETDETQKTCFS